MYMVKAIFVCYLLGCLSLRQSLAFPFTFTQGPLLPSDFGPQAGGGKWNFPERVKLEDGFSSTCPVNGLSKPLVAHFEFQLPSSQFFLTLKSFVVGIKRSATGGARDSSVRLFHNMAPIGNELAKTALDYPAALTFEQYGTPGIDSFGVTGVLTANDIVAGAAVPFGVALISEIDNMAEAQVDTMQMTVRFSIEVSVTEILPLSQTGVGGGATLTLKGTNFFAASAFTLPVVPLVDARVRFNSTTESTSVTVINATTIEAEVPAALAGGIVDVELSMDGGFAWTLSTAATRYEYIVNCPNNCNAAGGGGQCDALAGACVCNQFYELPACTPVPCVPACNAVHGQCVEGVCVCSDNYSGNTCDTPPTASSTTANGDTTPTAGTGTGAATTAGGTDTMATTTDGNGGGGDTTAAAVPDPTGGGGSDAGLIGGIIGAVIACALLIVIVVCVMRHRSDGGGADVEAGARGSRSMTVMQPAWPKLAFGEPLPSKSSYAKAALVAFGHFMMRDRDALDALVASLDASDKDMS